MLLDRDFACLGVSRRDQGWFVPHHEVEGGDSSGGVCSVVVRYLSVNEPVGPVSWLVLDEDAEVEFKFLVDSFRRTIGLGVVGG